MVKGNQATLKEEIAAVWKGGPLPPPQVADTGQHGGRVEQRRLWTSELLVGYSGWPHLAQVCRLERIVQVKWDPPGFGLRCHQSLSAPSWS